MFLVAGFGYGYGNRFGLHRYILELVAVDELTVTDAAVALGVKPGTARVRLHRARRRLARLAPAVPQPSNPALEEALT